jgi:hypothetical protein
MQGIFIRSDKIIGERGSKPGQSAVGPIDCSCFCSGRSVWTVFETRSNVTSYRNVDMTGYTVHTGTSKKFVSGWDRIFTSAASKNSSKPEESSAEKPSKKKQKKKPAVLNSAEVKKTSRKAAKKKTSGRKKST